MVVGAALAARRRHESAAEVSNMDRMLSVRNHTEYRFVVSGIQARESVPSLCPLLPSSATHSCLPLPQAGLASAHAAAHGLLRRALSHSPEAKEEVLGWASLILRGSAGRAAHIRAAASRLSPERARVYTETVARAAPDESLVALSSVLLRLCAPFLKFDGAPPPATLAKLSLRFYEPRPHVQRPDYAPCSRLAGRIVAPSRPAAGASPAASPASGGGSLFPELDEPEPAVSLPPASPASPGEGGCPNHAAGEALCRASPPNLWLRAGALPFVGEAFFLAQYAMHVGLLPAVRHMEFHKSHRSQALAGREQRERDEDIYRMQECWIALLAEPTLLALSLDFTRLHAGWLASLARASPPQSARRAFEAVPQFALLDMAAWLRFVATCRPDILRRHPAAGSVSSRLRRRVGTALTSSPPRSCARSWLRSRSCSAPAAPPSRRQAGHSSARPSSSRRSSTRSPPSCCRGGAPTRKPSSAATQSRRASPTRSSATRRCARRSSSRSRRSTTRSTPSRGSMSTP